MQNRYVGDIGDYVKLAILRALSPDRRLGVVWWLHQDEHHNSDGGHREYLERAEQWRHLDPDLFEALSKIEARKERDVHALENPEILGSAVFASDPVPCELQPYSLRPERWRIWMNGTKEKLRECDLIFVDPDNGIAPEGLRLTLRLAGKYASVEQLQSLGEGGRAMVVYHHQGRFRGGHDSEICSLAGRLARGGFNVSGALRAKPWSPRVFLILNADNRLCKRVKRFAELWGSSVSWHPADDIQARTGFSSLTSRKITQVGKHLRAGAHGHG